MSISKGAFGQSAKGSFIESRLGARGWGLAAVVFAQTHASVSGTPLSNVYGVSNTGTVAWTFQIGASSGGAGASSPRGRMGMDDECVYVPFIRSSAWTGSSGAIASVLALRKADGSVKWSFDPGNHTAGGTQIMRATFALGDGSVLVAGTRSDTWAGATGTATLWKLDSTGAIVWAYLSSAAWADLTVDASGNIFLMNATVVNPLVKLDSSGTLITSATYPTDADAYANIDTDTSGSIYTAYSTSGAGTTNLAIVNNTLTGTVLSMNVAAVGADRCRRAIAMSVAGEYAMAITTQTVSPFAFGLFQVAGGATLSGALRMGTNSSSSVAGAMDLSASIAGGLRAYCGCGRTSDWSGLTGQTGNLGRALVAPSSWASQTAWEWLADLSSLSSTEEVVRIAGQKHWNAT